MGIYLNPCRTTFSELIGASTFVDKSLLISHTNSKIRTNQKYICVSRPRRFGKTVNLDMLSTYYNLNGDALDIFKNMKVSTTPDFNTHLNKYNVIYFNGATLFKKNDTLQQGLKYLERKIIKELSKQYKDLDIDDEDYLEDILQYVYDETGISFIFLIDEWDAVFRIQRFTEDDQKQYLDFLRDTLKDKSYIALAYMTGILPIKKYGEHSALNMFKEYSMTNAKDLAPYMGFTQEEVNELCDKFNVSQEEMKVWYNGYTLSNTSIYNPHAVSQALIDNKFQGYWTATESFEALKRFIALNLDNLKEKVVKMIAGEEITILDVNKFENDMVTFRDSDDVLILLVHLGYLTYDENRHTVRIPNNEIKEQFLTTIRTEKWQGVTKAMDNSESLLHATLKQEADKVAEYIDIAHRENCSILQYNDENSLSCIITIAYYTAQKDYTIIRELPTGNGYADIVFIPKRHVNLPAIIVELKYNQKVQGAIKQIEKQHYISALKDFKGEILLVGINYDKKTKKHQCIIKKVNY